VGLGSGCPQPDACNDTNAMCNSGGKCVCGSGYYDSNGANISDGTCTATIPVITSLTFTIRLTGMNFTDDLKVPITGIYNTTRDILVQSLDALLGHFPGYSGASLLSFRSGSVIADAMVSVDQTGNISTIQTALQQSVSSGYIGLNGTRIAVDSTYFIAYIGDGYTIVDDITISNAGDIYNGSSANITCMTTVVGNVTSTYTWKYNGAVMNPISGFRISISNITVSPDTPHKKSFTVSFNPIKSSDSGTYECVVTDGNLAQSVMNKTVIVWSPPLVSIKPVTQTVNAESTVNITCQVENDVQITRMVWYRNDTEINLSNQISVETFLTVSILTHKNISQTTIYKCRGENAAGPGNTRQANIYVVLPGSQPGGICDTDTDKRETEWSRTLQGTYDNKSCPAGMSGEAVRYCSQGGVWSEASYDNCINKTLLDLKTMTENIKNGLAPDIVEESLVKLTNVTNPKNVELQKAEIQVVSSVLENIIQISNNTKNITKRDVENFLEIASNVIDVKNSPSWQAVIKEDKKGASIVLQTIEEYSRIIAKSINSADEPVKKFKKENLLVEIGYKPVSDIRFPSTTANGSGFNNDPGSRFVLSQDALNEGNYTFYSGAYFNNVSGIIQTNVFHNGSMTKTTDDLHINSAVMSLQLDPSPQLLSSPITLTFKHLSKDYSNPMCSFWIFNADGNGSGAWSSQGCKLVSTTHDTTVCHCDHLTNFAILMSPGKTPDKDQVLLSIISIIGCAISIFCLSVTMIAHFIAWRYVKSPRSRLLMNLSLALLISYIIFLAGIDRTENKNACTAVAALLHYFYLAVFFLMLAYGIDIAVSVIYVFSTRSHVQWLLPFAWILPAVIVAVSLGVTKLEGYGNEKFCWLSIEDGLIWAFVGPVALVILLNFIIILVVFQRMFNTSAMMTKSDKFKAKTAVRSLCVLLPITGITWVFGILSVNEDLVVFQYLFAIINSLQGLFIFLFHCFFNHHLRNAIEQINAARRRSQIRYSLTLNSISGSSRPNKFDSLGESKMKNASNTEDSSKNSFLGSDRQMQNQADKYAKDGEPDSEYVASSKNIRDKRGDGNVKIENVKISNILRDSDVRSVLEHTEFATTSMMTSNASSSADIDTEQYKSLGEHQKYDCIDASRQGSSPGAHQKRLEPRLDNNLRAYADGAVFQRLGQKSSQSYDKALSKSGFDPHDPRYGKSIRYDRDQTSSKERLSIRYDQDQTSSKERLSISPNNSLLSSREKLSTKLAKSENAQSKRVLKDEVYYKRQSPPGGIVPVSNSKSRQSKDYKSKTNSSKSSRSDEENKVETNRQSSSTRKSKAKDTTTAKKQSKPWKGSSKRSHDYQYSEYHMAFMGPKIYLGRTENTAGYVSYNPYGRVHAYGDRWRSSVNPEQYHQPLSLRKETFVDEYA
ncbi:hypothetical protein CHS0354_027442, partial [Potamilus streckersoni]